MGKFFNNMLRTLHKIPMIEKVGQKAPLEQMRKEFNEQNMGSSQGTEKGASGEKGGNKGETESGVLPSKDGVGATRPTRKKRARKTRRVKRVRRASNNAES